MFLHRLFKSLLTTKSKYLIFITHIEKLFLVKLQYYYLEKNFLKKQYTLTFQNMKSY